MFEDCVKGGKPKAEAAAEALKKIFPGVVSCEDFKIYNVRVITRNMNIEKNDPNFSSPGLKTWVSLF